MSERAGVIPATLSFLAIYNPSLSTSDDDFEDQIVYYYSKPNGSERKSRRRKDFDGSHEVKEERDEKLRQIGLAQGMVSFAKNFSNDEAVDCIETEKSRIILHELEPNWWLLASVDLTVLRSSSDIIIDNVSSTSKASVEYSAREICPPALLLQLVLRANRIFLLHQAPSLADLLARISRLKLCEILKNFWDRFIWNWDVLLHGNPAVDVFNGIKLTTGGELGVGVGEEEWGSGEREVLEGFVGRTDGLVDLVVSRFGDVPDSTMKSLNAASSGSPSFGVNLQNFKDHPMPSDGIVFSGIGAVTRNSVRDLSAWMDWLHMYGHNAYGVQVNPSSSARRKRNKAQSILLVDSITESGRLQGELQNNTSKPCPGTGIPPPLVIADNTSTSESQRFPASAQGASKEGDQMIASDLPNDPSSNTDVLMKYLTLGVYGSSWGLPSGRPLVHSRASSLRLQANIQASEQKDPSDQIADNRKVGGKRETSGFFLIGLRGQLEEDIDLETTESGAEQGTDADTGEQFEGGSSNNRVMMRTIHVERVIPSAETSLSNATNAEPTTYHDRLRVVVYVQKPFVFTFLFELHTDSLAIPSFYRSIHHQLGPLQRPLLASTSPSRISQRLWEAATPKSTASTSSSQPIYDLFYDPIRLTVQTTIPNIPEIGSAPSDASSWTRVEALSVHSQILNTFTSTRRHSSELERTCKTSRGWWVVWVRLPPSIEEQQQGGNSHVNNVCEAFLVRKASDYVAPAVRKPSGRFGRDVSGKEGSGGWSPGRLAEGIGVDARQYVEGLLSLNR